MAPCDPRDFLRQMLLALAVVFAGVLSAKEKEPPPPPPIRALLVTGGSSHEYQVRQEILTKGIRERVLRPIEWVVRMQGLGESDVRIPLFESAEWAKDYDIVVHDHCFPRVRDTAYVDRVLAPHRAGLPAVLLHGTMMSFRIGDERWFDFTGLTTRSHERERAVQVEVLAPGDPIMKGFQPWEIPREELYRVEQVKSGAVALTRSLDPAGQSHTTTWTHRYGPAQARVFGTTLGNATATVADARYLDLITRGFLWSLGELSETSFRVVPASESLKGITVEAPSAPLLRPGWNLARQGEASAFSWGADAAPADVALSHDGDPATAWVSEKPGPGVWEISWDRPRPVKAVAIFWQGKAPPEARLEGSDDGLIWAALGDWVPGTEQDAIDLVSIQTEGVSRLRLSVPRTAPGQGFGLREFGVYSKEDEIPSALVPPLSGERPASRFQSAGTPDALSSLELAPGWKVIRQGSLPDGGMVSQIIPTASGSLFVSVFPTPDKETGTAGSVYRLSPNPEGGLDAMLFLKGLPPAAQMAWDGEWLYTLSGSELNRVRRALGPGPADERSRLGKVYSLPAEGAPQGLSLSQFRLGNDGWLYALASAGSGGVILNAEGESVHLSRRAVLRFRRDGHGLSVCLRSEKDETDYGWNAPGEMVWTSRQGRMGEFVKMHGEAEIEPDGRFIWVAMRNEEETRVACLAPAEAEFLPAPVWNEIHPAALVDFMLLSDRDSVLREGSLELLRRQRDPGADLERLIAAAPSPELKEALVSVVDGLNLARSLPWLVQLAGSTDPALQIPAFLALGTHPGAVGHPVFAELGETTVPAVSAAILEALRRSRSSLPGSEEVALGLTSHPDGHLAETARRFLLDRGASEVAFAALDDSGRKGEWPGAFAMLKSSREAGVVEELIYRIQTTRDPGLRQSALQALCALYCREGESQVTREDRSQIVSVLNEALGDHRISPTEVLGAMKGFGLPEVDPETLVGIARRDLSFESAAVDALLSRGEVPSPETKRWLLLIHSDPSRDGDLRLKSLALLARHGEPREYRRWFVEVAGRARIPSLTGAGDLVREGWLDREDHGPGLVWLMEQTKGKVGETRQLAWETLLAQLEDEALAAADRENISKAVNAVAAAGGETARALVAAIPSAPLSTAGRVIAAFAGQADPAMREEVAKRARERGLDPRSGKPLVGPAELDAEALVRALAAVPENLVEGRRLFRTLACGECHNIHGEGPAPGPDLAAAVATLSPTELLESLRDPGKRIASGFETRQFETLDGRVLKGWVESSEGGVTLRDRAGNELSIKAGDLAKESTSSDHFSGCPGARLDGDAGFSPLLVYLRTLAP